ncbi:MAG: RNA polymerase sigma factor [Candidatus Yanofskybacteria bacterium]|nr:RNA polymerase sigma factor [Candidatus Yanofskybacteria bacterium]
MEKDPSKNEKEFLDGYDQWSDALFRHCFFRVRDRETAKDIVQETYIKTWHYIQRGHEIENLRAFLYRVANNLIIDWSRKKKESSLDSLMNQGFDVPMYVKDRYDAVIEGRHILEIIKDMDPKYRDAILMRYIDDLTPKEISQVVDESENVISVRIHRGLQQLRKILDEKNYGR